MDNRDHPVMAKATTLLAQSPKYKPYLGVSQTPEAPFQLGRDPLVGLRRLPEPFFRTHGSPGKARLGTFPQLLDCGFVAPYIGQSDHPTQCETCARCAEILLDLQRFCQICRDSARFLVQRSSTEFARFTIALLEAEILLDVQRFCQMCRDFARSCNALAMHCSNALITVITVIGTHRLSLTYQPIPKT